MNTAFLNSLGRSTRRTISFIGLLTLLFASAVMVAAGEEVKDGVFIHVSSGPDDSQRVLMALKMASVMSEDHDVLLYFDVSGVSIVTADGPNLEIEPYGTSKRLLALLVERGVLIEACPSCLKAAGKSKEDLAEGVKLADKKDFFGFTDGRVISLSY